MKGLLEKGLTLVELMVALLLGSILMLGVIQLVISSTSLGTVTKNITNNQAYANAILDALGSEIRLAGYRGCTAGGKLDLKNAVVTHPGGGATLIIREATTYPIIPHLATGGEVLGGIGLSLRFAVDENLIDKANEPFFTEGGILKTKDCLNRDLYWREVRIINCKGYPDNEPSICLGKLADPVIGIMGFHYMRNATLDKVVISILDNDTPGLETYKDIIIGGPDATYTLEGSGDVYGQLPHTPSIPSPQMKELLKAKSITLYITVVTNPGGVADSDAEIKRQYSATYNLRNM